MLKVVISTLLLFEKNALAIMGVVVRIFDT
jgi:hypothetical protein